MTKIRVVSAIASASGVTVFLENGDELNLKKDTKRTADILDQLINNVKIGGVTEIDIETFEVFAAIETKTNGAVRFVRGTLSKLKSIFGKAEEEPQVELTNLGSVRPSVPAAAPTSVPAVVHATIGDGELHAVVEGKVIPVAGLERHIEAAAETVNAVGLQRFLERLAKVIDHRSHTVKELMRFMERGDLPIADDGTIVAYKVLKTGNGAFVDCHSGQVTQRLGSFVQMDEKLIDDNRRNECSTGLHIARRGYLKHFSGNIITLVKVAPEDVIAVPDYDANKMRARGYHIVNVLPSDVHATLRNNQPMTGNTKAAQMLADAIAGKHVGVLEIVNIGAATGGNVTITPADGKKIARHERLKSGEAKALPETVTKHEVKDVPQEVSIRDLRKKVDAAFDEKQAAKSAPKKAKKVKAPDAVPTEAQHVEPKVAPKKKAKAASPTPAKPVVAQQIPEKYQQALKLLSEGVSQRQIAKDLGVCPKTLRKYAKG